MRLGPYLQCGLLGACDSEHARYGTYALLIALWQGTMDDPAAHDARCASECPGQAAAPVAMNLKVTSTTESALKLDSGYLSLGLKINDVGAFRCQFSTCSSLRCCPAVILNYSLLRSAGRGPCPIDVAYEPMIFTVRIRFPSIF